MEIPNKLISKICTPNPKVYKNPDEAQLLFNKNKTIFITHFIGISIVAIQVFFTYNSPNTQIIPRIIALIISLLIFMICCRSYRLTGHILNTLLMSLAAFRMMNNQSGVYISLSMAYVNPMIIYFMTHRIVFVGLSCCWQLFLLLSKYKHNLTQELIITDPEDFSERFVKGSAFAFFGVQIIYLAVLYLLDTRTFELSKATKAAQEALDQQKTFVFSFSHEMRNPMNSLLGNLDLVLMTPLPPQTRDMINTAKICGVLLLNLINTVLDAGKLGIGKLEVKPVPTKIHDIMQRLWFISNDLITQKGLKSHLNIKKKVPPRLILDGHRVGQILMNLIGNAIKFTETGSVSVGITWIDQPAVTDKCFEPKPYDNEDEGLFEKENNMYQLLRTSDRPGENDESYVLSGKIKEFNLEGMLQPLAKKEGVLKITVRDTGCGMAEKELNKLFQKFSQVGNDDSKKQLGTGLGLYISKEICKNMGGDIRAYSKLRKGSTFIVCIPTTALAGQESSQLNIKLDDGVIPRIKAKKLNAIVADDSPLNVNLVTNFLSKVGVEVSATANNGQITYERYVEAREAGKQVDLVTLDIDMPVMNGKMACELIREYERQKGLRPAIIMLISGNYLEEEVVGMLDSKGNRKADCFLKKPLIFDEFCWALYKCLITDFQI